METLQRLQSPVIKQRVLAALFISVLFVLPLWGRCVYESWQGLEAGRLAIQEQHMHEAIQAFAKALRWRGLFNPYAQQAQHELLAIEGKLEGAERVFALRELRRALFASRNFYLQARGDQELIAEVTAKLDSLGARNRVDIVPAMPFRISFKFQILSQVGFWGWVCSVLALIWYGFTRKGEIRRKPFILALILSVAFFAFWLVMLSFA